MKTLVRTAGAAILALFAVFVILPAGAAGTESVDDQAKFAGWLSSAVEERVKAELSGSGKKMKSVKAHVPERYQRPGDFDAFDIYVPEQNRNGSRLFVSVSFRKDGKVVSRINVTADIEMTMNAVAAARDIDRGRILGGDDIVIREIPAGAGYDGFVTDPGEAIGFQVDRSIKAGDPLRSAQLSKPKLVRAGDVVTIVADSGVLRITALGKAKQEGDRDEWIRVENIDSNKVINARITGPGEVAVEF